MKTVIPILNRNILALATLSIGLNVLASDPTAFALMKEGNRYIGEQAKDRVVQIRAEKSVGSTTPKVWIVVYRDDTASAKAVEVKFIAGKMADVKRPLRIIELISDKADPLDQKKLKVDSDKAIQIALNESILEKLKITATAPKLEDGKMGPVWKVRLWAAKLRDPGKDADLGEVHLLAEDGKVVKVDINLKRVD
jgi:hypothetical protein